MRELATLLENEGSRQRSQLLIAISVSQFCWLSQSKKLRELRAPMVQTCNILRQLIYTEKQIVSTSKTQSLDLKRGAANITDIHKFSDILICKSACEKLM